jgi:poly(hydroxyalkanoate) depolymerase family esterase
MRSAIVIVSSLCGVAVAGGRAEAELEQVTDFGANPGELEMFEYVPAGLAANRPLVVVLHGCTQTAAAMETAGWNALADAHGFAVLYPQQRSANQPLSCFTWYAEADIRRGAGEPASIMAMIDHEIATRGVDPDRVYVTGVSAGGAFTTTMLAAYPERFAAGSAMAGLPYACATSIGAASGCQQMTAEANRTPAQWGDLVRAADPGFSGTYPRVQVWQGTADVTVAPANADEIVEQWTDVWDTDQTADATTTIGATTRDRFEAAGGGVAVERYLIDGMGHAIAIGGDDDLGACPATTGLYFANVGICSTLRAAEFFGLLEDDGGSGGDDDGGDDDGGGGGGGGGGCSASGDAGAGLIVALLLLVSRRPRARRGGA